MLYGQVAGDLETCSWLCRIMSPQAKEDGGLGNLFMAVANHVAPSQRWQGTQKLVHCYGESCRN